MDDSEIVLRLRCKEGCFRVRAKRSQTISDLLPLANEELKKKKVTSFADLITKDPRYTEVFPGDLRLCDAKFSDGEMLYMKLSGDQIAGGKVVEKGSGPMSAETIRCSSHGPNASCVQCMIAKRITIIREKEPSIKGAVQFDMNSGSKFQNLVYHELLFQFTRLGVLYGTISDSGAEVHFVYEPPQIGESYSVHLAEGWKEEMELADSIARSMDMSRIGIIVSHSDVEYNISTEELMLVGELWEPGATSFLFAVLAIGESGEPGIEPFEITKRFIDLYKTEIFSPSDKPSVTRTSKEIYVDKTYCRSIDNDYFLLPLGIQPFESFLRCEFPIENRGSDGNADHLKALLDKYKHISFQTPIGDFHLLLFLTKMIGTETITEVASIIQKKGKLGEGHELLINSMTEPF